MEKTLQYSRKFLEFKGGGESVANRLLGLWSLKRNDLRCVANRLCVSSKSTCVAAKQLAAKRLCSETTLN